MNKLKLPKRVNLKSNIKLKPNTTEVRPPKSRKKLPFSVSGYYFLSWAIVASLSVASLTTIVMNEGGVNDAIKTASFNKINRQISENNFLVGTDSLPTASIPQGTDGSDIGGGNNLPSATNNRGVRVNSGAKASRIVENKTYSVFLGQGGSQSGILDLWYSIKNQNTELFISQKAGYYYNDIDGVFNLVVGEFTSLGKSLQFCAELKFNDIACRYDDKFSNLQTTLIH